MTTYPLNLDKLYKNRRLFVEEGQHRGYTFTRLDPTEPIFQIEKDGKGFINHYFPFDKRLHDKYPHIADKNINKELMAAANMHTPKTLFTLSQKTHDIIIPENITYPVVAKPADGSLGKNVFINITNDKDLRHALEIIQQSKSDSLVEEMILIDDAKEYRIIVVDHTMIACTQRRPASIVGNGINTIRELVDLRNQEPSRGPIDSRTHTLHYMPKEKEYTAFLAAKNLSPNFVPNQGDRISIDHRVTSVFGADLIDQTQKIHSDLITLCENFTKKNDFFIIGFDIIAEDISLSPDKQTYFFNEFNTRPFFDINECVNFGDAPPISALIWDAIEKHKESLMKTTFSIS